MKAFAYVNAANEKEAVAALASGGMDARTAGPDRKYLPLAGGMDLLARMKDYTHQPDVLVNVKNLDATIRQTPDGGLRIGSAVKLIDVIENDVIAKNYPAFHYAAAEVGTPQIRHLGTVGGNLNQRPRCWYFRNEEFNCLKKGGSRCFSVDGENQFHAIFGEGPCHIVHPSSLAVPSMAYGARFRVVGPNGEREVAAEDYFVMPDRSLFSENVLAPDELLTHVILPAPRNLKSASYEVRFKPSHDWPIAMATRRADDEWLHRADGTRRHGCRGADTLASAGSRGGPCRQADYRSRCDRRRGGRAQGRQADERQCLQSAGGEDSGETRAAAGGRDGRLGVRAGWGISQP